MFFKFSFLLSLTILFSINSFSQTGCTNENAANYNAEAVFDDGSCAIWDCVDAPYSFSFAKENFADPSVEINQDRITDEVWLTRGNSQGLFNAFDEEFHIQDSSPAGTLWKQGAYNEGDDPTDGAVYMVFRQHHGQNSQNLPGTISTVYLTNEESFYEIHWEDWTSNGSGGGFSYTRIFKSAVGCNLIAATLGCTNEASSNYNELATLDDGSCIYEGCIDPSACNFDEEANSNDGSCLYVCPGCTDSGAANYDPNANLDDGSCAVWDCYPAPYTVMFVKESNANPDLAINQDRITEDVWIARGDNQGLYNAFSEDVWDAAGEEGPENTLWKFGPYDPSDTPLDDYMSWRDHCNSFPPSQVGNISTIYLIEHDLYFQLEWMSWAQNNSGGGFSYIRTFIATDECSELEATYGCTDEAADNYDETASLNDGSCLYSGCTDPNACNYDAMANDDDGSCTEICPGCTAIDAGNYDPLATVDDGSCGVWDCYPSPYLITFSKGNYDDPTVEENQDRVTDEVWITRGDSEGLFNAFSEAGFDEAGENGPENTVWKSGDYDPSDDPTNNEVYMSWRDHVNNNAQSLPGKTSIVYLVSDDLYFQIKWLTWTSNSNGGGFSYERTFIGGGDCSIIPVATGCTNENANNYDINAILDNGSCLIDGCVDPDACNYDDQATLDDESCTYDCPGCTDPGAENYNSQASEDDGSCFSYTCFNGGVIVEVTKEDNGDPEMEESQDRVTEEIWLSRNETGGLFNVLTGDDTETLWRLGAWEPGDNPADDWQDFESHNSGNFNQIEGQTSSFFIVEDSLVFNVYWTSWTCCNNGGGFSYIRTFVPEASNPCAAAPAIYGCTNPEAVNYDPNAESDNGTCSILGCTNVDACNYDEGSNLDDGSCILNSGEIEFDCPADINYILLDNQLAVVLEFDTPVLQGVCPSDGGAFLVNGLSSGSVFPIGTTSNTFEINNEGEFLSCTFEVNVELQGCTDSEACNYNENANVDNGTCTFETDDPGISCPDDITAQVESDNGSLGINYAQPVVTGLCDTEVELGVNLFLENGEMPGAQFPVGITPVYWLFDDETDSFECQFFVTVQSYFGCTNPDADNYNSNAAEDDGSCVLLDCDGIYDGPISTTFTKESFADWNLESNQDRVLDNLWMTRKDQQGLFNIFDQAGYTGVVGGPSNTEWYLGTTDSEETYTTWSGAANNDPSVFCNNNSQMVLKVVDVDLYFDITWHSFIGGDNGGGFSYTRSLDIAQSGCNTAAVVVGCMDLEACNYNEDANIEDESCLIPEVNCTICNEENTALVLVDADNDGVCDANEIEGCTSSTACNFNEEATEENGTCIEPVEDCSECEGAELVIIDTDEDGVCDADEIDGCTSLTACNYNENATEEDDSCNEPVEDCSECDGAELVIIDTDEDGVCDADEVPGCTDPDCLNFNPDATEEDGSCEDCANGVEEFEITFSATYFMNQFTEQLTIDFTGITTRKVTLQVWNAQGKEVHTQQCVNVGYNFTEVVDLRTMSPGIYIVAVQANDVIQNHKIIKE